MAYSEVTVSGYNASPPPDDGSTGASNQVTWAAIKTKLTDPLNTAIAAVDDNVAARDAIIQTDIDTRAVAATVEANLYAPSGTIMLFQQTSAPTGWTKSTTHNDKALRIVSGTASSGGTTAFTSVLGSRTIAKVNLPAYNLSHSLSFSDTTTSNGSHNHSISTRNVTSNTTSDSSRLSQAHSNGTATSTDTASDGAHTHTVSGSVTGKIGRAHV